jgi:hypothetical protein
LLLQGKPNDLADCDLLTLGADLGDLNTLMQDDTGCIKCMETNLKTTLCCTAICGILKGFDNAIQIPFKQQCDGEDKWIIDAWCSGKFEDIKVDDLVKHFRGNKVVASNESELEAKMMRLVESTDGIHAVDGTVPFQEEISATKEQMTELKDHLVNGAKIMLPDGHAYALVPKSVPYFGRRGPNEMRDMILKGEVMCEGVSCKGALWNNLVAFQIRRAKSDGCKTWWKENLEAVFGLLLKEVEEKDQSWELQYVACVGHDTACTLMLELPEGTDSEMLKTARETFVGCFFKETSAKRTKLSQ